MIYTKLTIAAMKLAYQAHHGQTDKGGMPYIFHPYHLAEQMADEYTTCVALLHDVVEDTNISLDDLKSIFPKEVTNAVALMTHDSNVPYLEYVRNIAANPIAKAVKLADIHHNSDSTRMPEASNAVLARYSEKYQLALKVLEEGE